MDGIDKAFILAAGLGTRMRPLTDSVPKPLVRVGGQSLLGRIVGQLETAGVRDIVINTHHHAQQISQHMDGHTASKLTFSHEPALLDTGGGVRKMLHHFGEKPFFVLSGDGFWTDKAGESALSRMAAEWDDKIMDILILLQPVRTMKLTVGVGDYDILEDGRAVRSGDKTGTHMFTSIRINRPEIFAGRPGGAPFSYLALLDEAEKRGRLFALEHRGDWHHISTPADLKAVDSALARDGARDGNAT